MQDYFKPRGKAAASKADAGGGVIRSEPVFAVVKDNVDPIRSGRLQVYIADFGAPDPDDRSSWVTVNYMTPFFGATQASGGSQKNDFGTFIQNSHSYGMWYSPPDIGSTVICIFINGDMNYGYWIGGVPEPELLQMVPAIGSSENVIMNAGEAKSYGGSTTLPVTNLNLNNPDVAQSSNFLNATKPVHSYLAGIFAQQGLIRDPVRGPITSSASRESPSRVGWGVSTPGRPIYEGGFTDENIVQKTSSGSDALKIIARRGGHSIVMDDGTIDGKDQVVRLRSSLGHQILMSDDGQCLHIIHSNGQSWIELGKEGTIDMYAMNSVNVRTQGDLNLHADNNINIHAKKDLNIAAENININTNKDLNFRVAQNFSGYILKDYNVKINGLMSMLSGGVASLRSTGAETYINGSKVLLNSGEGPEPAEVKPIPLNAQTDTLFDKSKGFVAAPAKLLTIVSRAPAHAPWANAGQGVDVKVSNNASSELPSAPVPGIEEANSAAGASPNNPTSPAVASTVPDTAGAASKALDQNVTSTMISSTATNAAANAPLSVATGTEIVKDATGKVNAAVGKLAMTPQQMESALVLKPGSGNLVTGLVQSGSTVSAAMTDNLFTGRPGAENLTNFINSTGAQVNAAVGNLQKAQTAMTKTGLMSGNETASSVAGMITSASTVSVNATTDFIKTTAGGSGATASIVSNVGSAVSDAMSSGKAASSLATQVTSGESSLVASLAGIGTSAAIGLAGAIDSVKGVAGSAFSAITSSLKSFKSRIPQNLKEISKTNAAAQANSEGQAAAPLIAQQTADIKASFPTTTDGISTLATGLKMPPNFNPSAVYGEVTAAVKSAVNVVAVVSPSGLNSLPGGAGAVSSIIDNSKNVNNIPSLTNLSGIIKDTASAVQNGISTENANASSLTTLSTGAMGDLINNVTSVASTAKLNLSTSSAGLAALTSANLPAGAAAQLQASMNSIAANGVKIPTVAVNTVNRGEITSQLASVLGSAKIPLPNFSSKIDLSASQATIDQQGVLIKEIAALRDSRFALAKDVGNARYALEKANTDLPQGDPAIDSAVTALNSAKQALDELDNKVVALQQRLYVAVTGNKTA